MKILNNFLDVHYIKIVVKHGLVSVTSALIDFSIFYAMFYYQGFSLNIAFVIAVFCSALIGFFGHTFYTFEVNKVTLRNFIYFIMQLTISFVIGFSIFKLFIYFQFLPEVSKIFQMFCTFGFNVCFGKFITFKKI